MGSIRTVIRSGDALEYIALSILLIRVDPPPLFYVYTCFHHVKTFLFLISQASGAINSLKFQSRALITDRQRIISY